MTGTLLAYHEPTTGATASAASQITQSSAPLPPVVTQTVRVAIYNEANTTFPTYAAAAGGALHNNVTQLAAMLNAHGVSTTLLTVQDIYNHKLQTAQYDVLALVDNLPRENITNNVLEFWLDGGSLLVFDSAGIYLCYFGILPPIAKGTTGLGTYWSYASQGFNVTARHPVSKAYTIGQTIHSASGYFQWDWSALQASSIGKNLTRVARSNNSLTSAAVLAFDPPNQGGKVVTFSYDYRFEALPALNQMIADAVNWLCPHPKARIAYDLSHKPYVGIDSWDGPPAYFDQWRNALVNRSYAFDKLYPSASGNLTASRLAPYDMLIETMPQLNFTTAEVSAVTSWINGGGSLFAMGENDGFSTENKYINYLLSNLNLSIDVHGTTTDSYSYMVEHPTTEGCTSFYLPASSYVNYTSPAYMIWGKDASNAVVAGQSFGSGRVLLIADVDWASTSFISQASNYQYAINVVNWLTAAKADVLVYVSNQGGSVYEPNMNVYRGPVAQALNDLGIPFYLTFGSSSPKYGYYFNKSLNEHSWNLVIVDNDMWPSIYYYYSELIDYMKAGGHLILYTYYIHGTPELNQYLGFSYNNDINTPKPIYVWNSAHDIFRQPNHYTAANISTTTGYGYGYNCINVTLYANASAIAGMGKTPSTTNASIILGVGGRAITNTVKLTVYSDDTDDSTYRDSFEIWENEIAYMLRPQCSLTPSVVSNVYQGTVLNVKVSVSSFGLRAAMQGQVTLNVPAGLGTLLSPAAQSFTTPLNPGSTSTLSWQVNVTGTGSSTLGFSASYRGYKGTSYGASSTAGTLALASPTPLSFAQYGFSIVSNATNFVVAASTTPQPGAAAPTGGQRSFIYLNMTGTVPPGYSVVYVKLYFSRAGVQQLGLNETTLSFSRWNATASQWQAIPTTVQILNSTQGVMTAYINHFSYFAVFAAPALGGAGIGMETLLIIAAAAVVVVVVVAFVVVRKRKR